MRQRPRFTIRLSLMVALTLGVFALAFASGMEWRPHGLSLGPRLGYLYWFDLGSIGLQRQVWNGPPTPIVITNPGKQSAGSRAITPPRAFWLLTHSKWEEGLIDQSFTPERFTPSGLVIEEWWAPSWPLFVLLLAACGYYFARWLPHFRKSRRVKAGLCPTCSYDLRAHKPGDKCPECGTGVESQV